MADLAGMVLSALKLKKLYGPVEALSSFSLSLEAGEFLCLVGPDGAGKSTALRLLCGLEKPDSGEIELFGRRVTRFSSDLRARLGYLPQGFSLYEDLSIEENLVFFAGALRGFELPVARGFTPGLHPS